MPQEQSCESSYCVHVLIVLGRACISSLHSTLFSADKIFMAHLFLPKHSFTQPYSREQGPLFEDRFGDPPPSI